MVVVVGAGGSVDEWCSVGFVNQVFLKACGEKQRRCTAWPPMGCDILIVRPKRGVRSYAFYNETGVYFLFTIFLRLGVGGFFLAVKQVIF